MTGVFTQRLFTVMNDFFRFLVFYDFAVLVVISVNSD